MVPTAASFSTFRNTLVGICDFKMHNFNFSVNQVVPFYLLILGGYSELVLMVQDKARLPKPFLFFRGARMKTGNQGILSVFGD